MEKKEVTAENALDILVNNRFGAYDNKMEEKKAAGTAMIDGLMLVNPKKGNMLQKNEEGTMRVYTVRQNLTIIQTQRNAAPVPNRI